MTKPGPKPRPAHLKLLEGNPGKRSINPGVLLPPDAPQEPDWKEIFPGNRKGIGDVRSAAARQWRTFVPVLDARGVLTAVDSIILTDACVCAARLQECERDISARGLIVDGQKGPVRNPSISAAAQYRQQLKFYVGELGLGPSSRTRLTAVEEPDDPDNPYDV